MKFRPEIPELEDQFAITARNLSIGHAPNDLWLSETTVAVEPGEYVTLTGENGSGKSTFMNGIQGMYDNPRRFHRSELTGQVFYGDVSIYDLTAAQRRALRSRHFAMVGQDVKEQLNPSETVEQNLYNLANVSGIKVPKSRFDEVVDYYEISKKTLASRVGSLSGGQKQIIPIMRSELTDPSVYMFDEPLAALDESRKGQVHNRFLYLSGELGKTIIAVGHDKNRQAPRRIYFELGRLVADTKFWVPFESEAEAKKAA